MKFCSILQKRFFIILQIIGRILKRDTIKILRNNLIVSITTQSSIFMR